MTKAYWALKTNRTGLIQVNRAGSVLDIYRGRGSGFLISTSLFSLLSKLSNFSLESGQETGCLLRRARQLRRGGRRALAAAPLCRNGKIVFFVLFSCSFYLFSSPNPFFNLKMLKNPTQSPRSKKENK